MARLLQQGLSVQYIQEQNSDPESLVGEFMSVGIPKGDARALIAAARSLKNLLFIQGSGSYLLKELNMEGVVQSKDDVIQVLQQIFKGGQVAKDVYLNPGTAGPRASVHSEVKFGDWLANYIYGFSLMNSSAMNCECLLANREGYAVPPLAQKNSSSF